MWTDARKDEAKRLWGEGFSASQIAIELGSPYLTRNQVIGMISRAGLARGMPRRCTVAKKRSRRLVQPAPRPQTFVNVGAIANRQEVAKRDPGLPAAAVQEPPSLDLKIPQLKRHHCRWPHGDGPEWRFCGARRKASSPYCEAHSKRAFNPIDPRKRRRR